MALLAWGPACYALQDRDRWVGWDATRRVERLSLVVQNRRFLLLTKRGEEPNFASQVLAAAVRTLPGHWQERFGYRPLLTEDLHRPGGLPRHVLQGLRVGAGRDQPGLRTAPRRLLPRARPTHSTCGCCGPCTPRPRSC
ncbi:MAG: DUF4338 domain-containing protein [Candidatus Synoicihabitans palmerolidicus]|nr:DUF4338 domain-containing protein [Candidatus Synoicihabitans palmerolidicus]